ncbi:MAG TPA: VWA domain-containing protein [bacterium]|nr:VWA domain-containing protein [bacterium]
MKFYDWTYFLTAVVWIPVIFFWVVYSSKKRNDFLKLFSKSQTEKIVDISQRKIVVKRVLIFLALSFFTVSAARPLMGGEEIKADSSGIDIAVVFDVSLSMYAEDESGPRFEKGRKLLIDVLSSLTGDRVAIIPFAGAAFLQLPLTDDYETLQTVVSVLEPGMIERQGTALGNALEMAVETLTSSGNESDRMIVVISDGEDPELNFEKVSKLIKENGIHLAVVPMGTVEGAPVRIGESYLKDENDNTVISKLDRGFFEKCFETLGAVEIKKGTTISEHVKNFKKAIRNENRNLNIYTERFQMPLFAGIIIFWLFQLLSLGRRRS